VESQMAALVAPGAPISVLAEYGLDEKILEKLLETGVGTIERLGSMTPEQLEEIQGIGPKTVEKIQESVNAYYSQFEDPVQEAGEAVAAEAGVEAEVVEGAVEGETAEAAAEAAPDAAPEATQAELEPPVQESTGEVETEVVAAEETGEQFGTIENAGSPHNQSGAGPEEGRVEETGLHS